MRRNTDGNRKEYTLMVWFGFYARVEMIPLLKWSLIPKIDLAL